MKPLAEIIDHAGTVLSRLRTMGLIILAIGLAFAILKNGSSKDEIQHLLETTTGLNFEKDVLHNHIQDRDKLILEKETLIGDLYSAIQRSEGKVNGMVKAYGQLFTRYESLADSITSIPPDSSYKFLNTTAYPSNGIRRFPFAEDQVQEIHITLLEKETLTRMNQNMSGQIRQLNEQTLSHDTIQRAMAESMAIQDATIYDQNEYIENQEEAIQDLAQRQLKAKKKNNAWHIIAAIIIAGLAVIAAGG